MTKSEIIEFLAAKRHEDDGADQYDSDGSHWDQCVADVEFFLDGLRELPVRLVVGCDEVSRVKSSVGATKIGSNLTFSTTWASWFVEESGLSVVVCVPLDESS